MLGKWLSVSSGVFFRFREGFSRQTKRGVFYAPFNLNYNPPVNVNLTTGIIVLTGGYSCDSCRCNYCGSLWPISN